MSLLARTQTGFAAVFGILTLYVLCILREATQLILLSSTDSKSMLSFCADLGAGNLPSPQTNQVANEASAQDNANNTTAPPHTKTDRKVVPDRIIAVFGLESSGTNFISNALSGALGAVNQVSYDDLHMLTPDNKTLVQHISLPWGWWTSNGAQAMNDAFVDTYRFPDTVPFIAPFDCMSFPLYDKPEWQSSLDNAPPHPACHEEIGYDKRVRYPRRFFVNIVEHVRWYQRRGANITAVLLIRDDSIHFYGKLTYTFKNAELAAREDEHGKSLLKQAIRELQSVSEAIVVSYETMMSLQKEYLFDLYQKLGINSTFLPTFKDGNKKYLEHKIT